MTAFSCMLAGLMVFLASANVGAQERAPLNLQTQLSSGAQIIETASLNAGKGKARMLVLWMLNPKRVMRQGDSPCGGIVYGDYWYGPTRLSLVDLSKKALINTIEIRPQYEADDEKDRGFPIPFHVSNSSYAVPNPDKDKEGVPKILSLRDMTGEGIAGQFVLFEFPFCGTQLTTALGYSPRADSAVQFRVELPGNGSETEIVVWVPHLFGEKPIRPGHWKFTWEPGYGADCWIHEQVSFDRKRQLFIEHQKITPYPDLPLQVPKKKD